MTTTNLNVTVKFFNSQKGFGFFKQKGDKDVFVHITVLEKYGFTKADMVSGAPAIIDFVEAPQGFIASKIHQIGDKQAAPTERRTIVDRNTDGDRVIVKVTDLMTGSSCYEIRVGSIDGHLLYEVESLAKARQEIGRKIVHPIHEGIGKPTNVVGNGPLKGPSPPAQVHGSGQPKKKKAA